MEQSVSIRFRKRLKELRQERHWTQEYAAEVCGIGHKVFQLYELGIKKNPGLVTLEKIARGFGMDVSELLLPSMPRMKSPKNAKAQRRTPRARLKRV